MRLSIAEVIALSGISRSQIYLRSINKDLRRKYKDNQGKGYIDKSVLLELENKYLKDQLEYYKLLEQKSFEREKSLQATINHYQQSLPNPDKKHKSDRKKRKKIKKNKG